MSLIVKSIFSKTSLVDASTASAVDTNRMKHITIQVVYTDQTPAALGFVDGDVTVAADTIDETAHGYVTGLKGQFTTTGTLPAGLSLSTDYFIIKVDADTYQVGTTLANAQAGTQVDITAAAGTGTHTFTAATVSGSVKLQGTIDGTNYTDLSLSKAFTATGSAILKISDESYQKIRAVYTHTAGMVDLDLTICGPIKYS